MGNSKREADRFITGKLEETDRPITGRLEEADRLIAGRLEETDEFITGRLEETDEFITGRLEEADRLIAGKLEETDRLIAGKLEETDRLIIRRFEETDIEALYLLLKDEEVNTYLPWFPVKSVEEARAFYENHFAHGKYSFAVCLKEQNTVIGYVKADTDDSHDFGYALCKEYWHRGIITEAGNAVIRHLKNDGFAYITATHDRNNPRSGGVMQQLGMKYCYSYEEQWQPKNIPVTFRMYQMNLDGQDDWVYLKYWNLYEKHFIEKNL